MDLIFFDSQTFLLFHCLYTSPFRAVNLFGGRNYAMLRCLCFSCLLLFFYCVILALPPLPPLRRCMGKGAIDDAVRLQLGKRS